MAVATRKSEYRFCRPTKLSRPPYSGGRRIRQYLDRPQIHVVEGIGAVPECCEGSPCHGPNDPLESTFPTGLGLVRSASKCMGPSGPMLVIFKFLMSNSSGSFPSLSVLIISCASSQTKLSTRIFIFPSSGPMFFICARCSLGGRLKRNTFTYTVLTRMGERRKSRFPCETGILLAMSG